MREELIENFIAENVGIGDFTDRVDASIAESIGEYGFVRNPDTNEVYYLTNGDKRIATTTITFEEVFDSILASDRGFFDYIGEEKTSVIAQLDNDRLAHYILPLQSYYGEMF